MTKQMLLDRVRLAQRAAREIMEDLAILRGPRPALAVLHDDGAWQFALRRPDAPVAGVMAVDVPADPRVAALTQGLLQSLRLEDDDAQLAIELYNPQAQADDPTCVLASFTNVDADARYAVRCDACDTYHRGPGRVLTFIDVEGDQWCSGFILSCLTLPVAA